MPELKLLQCRPTVGVVPVYTTKHKSLKPRSIIDRPCKREQQLDFPDLVDNKPLLKVGSCQNIFKYTYSQLNGFFTLGKFSRFSVASLLYCGDQPCNPEFESLHRYPLSCASVSEKSVSKTLCADQKSRQSFNSPRVDFCIFSTSRFVSCHIHFIMRIHSNKDDVISTTFIAYL